MIWPSGLKQGTMRKTTFSRMRRASSSVPVSRSYASSGAIWVPPISVAWRLMDWQMTARPSLIRASASSVSPLGSLSLRFTSLSRSRFLRLSAEEMITSRKGLPSVEEPISTTLILSLCVSSSLKYATILSHRAIFLSLPSLKPKNSSGGVTTLDMRL